MTTKKSNRWWPKAGEDFYAILNLCDIFKFRQRRGGFKKHSFILGVYPTRGDAQTALRKIKKFVKEEL